MPPGVRTPIPAPENRAPASGLVAIATAPDLGDVGERWINGFGFDPETCGDPQLLTLGCSTEGVDKDVPDNPAAVLYDPAILVGGDKCSTMGGRPSADRLGRARRHLLSTTSWGVERLFWTGVADGDVAGTIRPSLTDGTAVELAGGTAVGANRGVALLDQALTVCLHGGAGAIHTTPLLLSDWADAGRVALRDGRWYTPSGHVVIAGSGYTGGAPRDDPGDAAPPAPPDLLANPAADQWAYGTGPVYALVGDIVTWGDEGSRIDRAVNDVTVLVERAVAAFHSGCCKFAVQIDMTPA